MASKKSRNGGMAWRWQHHGNQSGSGMAAKAESGSEKANGGGTSHHAAFFCCAADKQRGICKHQRSLMNALMAYRRSEKPS